MSEYIVSALKYRPLTFDTVVGQKGLTTTLKNAISTGKLAHAYLFCGPRGVGKTTSARIFAKSINCFHPTSQGDACGQCESCRAFDERRSFNIHELDAASNNSVDDIRTLIEEVQIPPQVGKYKVFIIDEVHMLSSSAFNAFLKTLEEPPSHVVFILATTEKHKILPTILSRCQVYDFNRITLSDTIDHLRSVAEKEGYKSDDEALAVIAEKADGGMRDALSIFDQVAAFTGGDLTYEKVVAHLGVLDTTYYFQIVDNLLTHHIPEAMLLLNEVLSKGFDAGLFINGLATHLRNVMMAREASTLPLLQCSESMKDKYGQQAKRTSDTFLYRALRLCNTCDINYRTSRNKRLLVEITLIDISQSDDPVAGRPATILKPIFEQTLATEPSTKPTSQIVQGSDSTPTDTIGQATKSSVNKAQTASLLSANTANNAKRQTSFGISITNPSAAKQTAAKQQTSEALGHDAVPSDSSGSMAWDEKTLMKCWLQYADSLPEEQIIMAQRMRATTPTLTADKKGSITIDNGNLLPDWERVVHQIERNLVSATGVSDIKIDIIVEEQSPQTTISRNDQFAMLAAKNPLLNTLKEHFLLDFA